MLTLLPIGFSDTCCIDKTSSVELSEAINSMYRYYKESQKCYTYLSDVNSEKAGEEFKKSRWWTRGWTLQELLAPKTLQFFNTDWTSIGYKDSLHETITEIVGIEHKYLSGTSDIEEASIAKRMSWAASRKTTREEDIAYSLIGIFDVNMAMLYGEGATRAFVRLQEEIMRTNEDQSIFAWVKRQIKGETPDSYHGLLADSPKYFEQTGDVVPYTSSGDNKPSTMTARGLNLFLPLTPKRDGTVVAALHCPDPGQGNAARLALYLQELQQIGAKQYARVDCDMLASVSELGQLQEVYVRQRFPKFMSQTQYPDRFFQIRSLKPLHDRNEHVDYKIVGCKAETTVGVKSAPTVPHEPWSLVPLVYQIDKTAGGVTVALKVVRLSDQEAFVIILGSSSETTVGAAIFEEYEYRSLESPVETFALDPAGAFRHLYYHSVRVSAEERVRAVHKIYFVDIEISGRPKTPTAAEVVQGAVEMFASPNRGTAKADFRDKVKRFLPKS